MSRFKLFVVLAALAGLVLTSGTPGRVWAGEPSREPILRPDTGMHTAMIRRIGIDAAGRFLVTASDDKTARVWDLRDGRLLRILRPPLGPGNEGKLYAAAMSPDGSMAACTGWTGWDWDGKSFIYIFDRQSGRLAHRITGLPNVIGHLAFSRDGRFLAAALGGKNGIRVYRVPGFDQAFQDPDYGSNSYWADFDPNGRLVTTCYDGFIRLYDKDFKQIAKKKGPGGSEPFSAVFSPDGSRIAVGYIDSTRVDVLSGRDLSLLYAPNTAGVDNGDLSTVAWSADGRELLAGGLYDVKGENPIMRWKKAGRGARTRIPGPQQTVMDIRPLPGGGLVYGSGDPAWGVLDKSGRAVRFLPPTIADYRGDLDKFLLSADGLAVQFGFKVSGKSPARFSIIDRELVLNPANSTGLAPPKLSAPKIKVTDWEDKYNPKLNGRPLELEQYECSQSLAIMPDGSGFLLGTEWRLRFYDSQGKEKWQAAVPGPAWTVNIAADGKTAAAAFADGTIRWYGVRGGKEILAFFPHNDQKRWVLWSPSGYYDASAGGEDLIGWHLNRGKDREADFFSASRFRDKFYRPDVVALVLETLDEAEAVKRADAEFGRKRAEADIRDMLPPVVRILAPADGDEVRTGIVVLKYSLRSPGGDPITGLNILIDGRPAGTDKGIVRRQTAFEEGEHEIRVDIPERDVEIGLIARNRHGASEPALVRLTWQGAGGTEEFVIKPRLYLLAVGVGDYKDDGLDLRFPAKDARDFAEVISKQQGKLYREVIVKLLTDDLAAKDDILDGLEWIGRQTTSHDVAMLYIGGHGKNDEFRDYYFLPWEADLDRLRRTALPFMEIQKTVRTLAGKTLVFVDTCHSGNIMDGRKGDVDINALVNELSSAENGAVVFASSTGLQYSLEDASWNNGAFTKALVEGLSGRADYTGQGRITINMLALYLSERVKELTGGRQTPTTTRPKTIPDYPIAVTK